MPSMALAFFSYITPRRWPRFRSLKSESSEDVARTMQYFEKFQTVILDYGIPSSGIWNMDETGFNILQLSDT